MKIDGSIDLPSVFQVPKPRGLALKSANLGADFGVVGAGRIGSGTDVGKEGGGLNFGRTGE